MRFVNARVPDIVHGMILSNLLSADSRATYVRYIRVGKIMIKNGVVLPMTVSPATDVLLVKTMGISHLDDPVLHTSMGENVLVMIEAADLLEENDNKHGPFFASYFNRYTRTLLDKLHVLHVKQNEEEFPSVALFLKTKSQQTRSISHKIMSLFITTVRTVDYDGRDKSQK